MNNKIYFKKFYSSFFTFEIYNKQEETNKKSKIN